MRAFQILALSTALAFPATLPALAEATGAITVTGEASIAATPDTATISLGVNTVGDNAAAAMAENSKLLSAVIERLKAAGIADADMQTANLYLSPNWVGYESGQTPTISNYTATNTLNVRVRDLSTLGGVLDSSLADGANTLNGITFELAAPRATQDEARKAAVLDAAAKAKLLAEAAGVKLGRITSISEQYGYAGPAPSFMEAKAASPVPVATGQIAVQAAVSITYELDE